MIETKTKFKIDVFKKCEGIWSFGICLSHHFEETYISINFFRWSISIGKLYSFDDVGKAGEQNELVVG